MNQAEMWDFYVKSGIKPDLATELVRSEAHKHDPASVWDALVSGGVKPDEATAFLKAHGAKPKPKTTVAEAIGNHLADSGTFGFGPKIVAAIESLKDNHDLSEYKDNLRDIRETLEQTREDHPLASFAGDIFGAFAIPGLRAAKEAKALTTGQRVANAAKVGGTYGAITGLGHSDGDLTDKIIGTGVGSIGGAAAGVAVDLAAQGAAALAHKVAGSATAQRIPRRVSKLMNPAMEEAGTSARELQKSPPDMLADKLPDLTRTVRSVSSKARRTIDQPLIDRQKEQIPVITRSLEKSLGVSKGSMRQSVNAIIEKQSSEAQKLYDAAYAEKDISDPLIMKIMRLPRFRQAYAEANKIELAKPDGVPLPPLHTGNIPVPASIADNADAVAAFKKAYLAQHPEMNTFPVRTIDKVKQGLDALIDKKMRGGKVARSEARELRITLDKMLKRTDELAPKYKVARATFAGHERLKEAAEAGFDFMNPKLGAADIVDHLNGLETDSEREMFRRGALEALVQKIESARGSATGSTDLVGRVYSSVGGRAKVRALFKSERAADLFHGRMEKLAEQTNAQKFIRGGSQTSDKDAARANLLIPRRRLEGMKHPWHYLVEVLQNGMEKRQIEHNKKAYESLAPYLVERGEGLREILKGLSEAGAELNLDERLHGALGTSGNVGGGLLNRFYRK